MNRLFKKQVGNYAYYNFLNKYEPAFLNKYQSLDHYKMGRKSSKLFLIFSSFFSFSGPIGGLSSWNTLEITWIWRRNTMENIRPTWSSLTFATEWVPPYSSICSFIGPLCWVIWGNPSELRNGITLLTPLRMVIFPQGMSHCTCWPNPRNIKRP